MENAADAIFQGYTQLFFMPIHHIYPCVKEKSIPVPSMGEWKGPHGAVDGSF